MTSAGHHSMMSVKTASPLPPGYTQVTAVAINNGAHPGSGFVIPRRWRDVGTGKILITVKQYAVHPIMLITGQKQLTTYNAGSPWAGYDGNQKSTGDISSMTPTQLTIGQAVECEIRMNQASVNKNLTSYIGVGGWSTDNGWSSHFAAYYKIEVYSASGDIVCDIYPCIRDADGKAGFYDIANNVFLRSARGYDYEVVN